MTMLKILTAAALAAALAGCASVGEHVLQAGTQGEIRFAPADVDAAIAIAVQAKDADAEACFRAIRKHVDQPFALETAGPVSAYAAARVRIREGRAGLAPEVRKECALLILDAAEFTRSFRGAIMGIGR